MPSYESRIERLPASRVRCTVTFTKEQVSAAEQTALQALSSQVSLKGFRPGKAPPEVVREKVQPEKLLNETLRVLMPQVVSDVMQREKILPIIPPKAEVTARDPLTLQLTFVEKPEVTLKGIDKIKIEKKPVAVDTKDVERVLESIMMQYRTFHPVEREAKMGDQVTMDFTASDEKKAPIPGFDGKGYQAILGKKTLLPGMEEQLTGLKKGEQKSFAVTLPEKHPAEHLRGKPVTFSVTMGQVEEVTMPELSDSFAKDTLKVESAAILRKNVETSLREQEEHQERMRREGELLDAIRTATKGDLPEELIEAEERGLLEDFLQRLEQQKIEITEWLKQTGKKPEDLKKDFHEQAEKRLRLRFGIEKLIEEKKVEVSEAELQEAIDHILSETLPDERKKVAALYAKGEEGYLQLQWQKKVEKALAAMLA